MILTSAQMKELEARAFSDGISAEALMEEAGAKIAAAVRQFFPSPGWCLIFFGKGHNGGDALVAGRWLAEMGWHIELRPAFPEERWAPLTRTKHQQFCAIIPKSVPENPASLQLRAEPWIVLDGLLGVGASGDLREPIRAAAREINHLRRARGAHVFALDLPTGLDADSGAADADAVVADFTLCIGFAKCGLLADHATNHVGRLVILPLRELTDRAGAGLGLEEIADAPSLATRLPRRSFEKHKGDCGRVAVVAGSPGMTGAAVMAAEACLHAGAGLMTLYVTPEMQPLIVPQIAPEIMVKTVSSYREVLEARHDVLALGPGLGKAHAEDVRHLIEHAAQPMIIDADGLNILASRIDLLSHCRGPRLLTPHPGEMARLDPASAQRSRRETVEVFTAHFPATLLLKGARTLVGARDRPLSYNSTGNPGMATGGMGDVLTGVCAALAGQGLTLYDAARLGAWLCGRAAELAIFHGQESEESLSARHIIAHLGRAFASLRAGDL